MSLEAIRSSIEAHAAASWSETPLAWDNLTYDAAARGPWLRISVSGSTGRQVTLGAPEGRIFRRRGQVRLQLFVPANSGPSEAAGLADRAAALFEGRSLESTIGPVSFAAADITETGADGHGWRLTLITVPFQADESV
ncbi:phage tail terminator-like protein [Oceanibaculum nanhaiense]|uniref:phage tail terminator-like protein n=1 Tax=Oceanibaculum nanhaiense TaxID=1909734 RepID=UPI0015947FE0|nr:phage tail terminator-like protein [Oceanibaculum nanhaiense]